MTDTAIIVTPSGTTGSVTITASAALFTADHGGLVFSLRGIAEARVASAVVVPGAIFYADDRGVVRLYRVIRGGLTAAQNMAGTTPNYDLNMPMLETLDVKDGTCVLKYLGRGKSAWGWGTITAVTDTTHATLAVASNGTLAGTSDTLRWRFGEWGGVRGYPRAVTFFQQRTIWAGSGIKPQTVWSSETGDFESMSPCEADGAVLDTNAITITLDDEQVNTARWVTASARGLVVGTASAPWLVGPSGTNGVLTPSNIRASRQGRRGSVAEVSGVPVENATLFVQRGGTKVREFSYDFGQDTYTSPDLTILSEHITASGLVDAAYQEQPEGVFWLARSDGMLITLTYDRDQEVRAWTRHQLAGGAVVESIAAVPAPDATTDDLYCSVRRTINGVTKRWVEVIRAPFIEARDSAKAAFHVDAGLAYSGAPATTFSGLGHLEGQTVQVWADGAVRAECVVSGGSVSIGAPAVASAQIGLGFTSRVTTMPPEAGAGGGTAQGKPKRVHEVILRLNETGAARVGRDGAMETLSFRAPDAPMGTAVPLFTGDRRVTFPGGWDRRGQVTVESVGPAPLSVLAIIEEITTSG